MEELKYPIGRFERPALITAETKRQWLKEIEELPVALARELDGLSEDQLDTPYRPEGWTIRQVAHHIGDSHLNSFMRFKLALTEDEPAIRPYDEAKWAKLADSAEAPVALSTALVSALHARWVYLLRSMNDEDYALTFYHPESKQTTRLDVALGIYAWHGRHHVAHITGLRERMGW